MHSSLLTFRNFIVLITFLSTSAAGLKVKDWCVPVFTPCDENRNLRIEVVPQYAAFLYRHGVDCVVVSGSSGEFSTLSLLEKKILLEAWVIEGRPLGFKIISHVGGTPYPDVIEMAKYSESVRVDAIMTIPETFYKPTTPEQLVEFMQGLAEAAPSTPLIYYHYTPLTCVNVDMPKFFALASKKIPNFLGIKTSLAAALDVQMYNVLKENQRMFIGGRTTASSILLGFDSTITTLLNMFPDQLEKIRRYGNESNTSMALKTQAELFKLTDVIMSQGEFVSTMKAAMEVITGIKVGPTRKPLTLITAQQKIFMAIKLQELGLQVSSEYRI